MKYEYILGNNTYNLSDSEPFEVVEIDGIDNAAITPITVRSPAQDGDTDKDGVLEPRIIQMVIQARNSMLYQYEDNRELFMSIFRPSKQLGTLRITFNNGKVREIDCRCLGNGGAKRGAQHDLLFKSGVALRCPDPLWRDPVLQIVNFHIAAGGGSFTVPTFVPTGVGSSILNQTTAITYLGTYRENPLIEVYGPITNLKIEHLGLNRKIALTGFSITAGHWYTFDLRFGRKFVYRDSNVTDVRTGEVTEDSHLATFVLDTHPALPDEVNNIRVTGTGGNSGTQVYIQYYNRFAGI
jgi:hypothetical protein